MSSDQDLEENDPYLEQSRRAADLRQADPVRAFEEIQILAEKGSVNGMFLLGSAYQFGTGAPVDLEQAETWYRRAYEKGSKLGAFYLGSFYLAQKKYPKAYEAFTAGAAMGHTPSADYICQLSDKENWEYWEKEPAVKELDRANGLLETDPVRAFQELRTLTEKGSPHSMLLLGWAYERGLGTTADMKQAETWYRRAYEKGSKKVSKEAACHLGYIYLQQKNSDKAHEAFAAGAAMDYAPAIYRLGVMYRYGRGVNKQPDKARSLFERASVLGHVFAKAELAKQLMSGQFGFFNIFRGFYMFLCAHKDLFGVGTKDEFSDRLWR